MNTMPVSEFKRLGIEGMKSVIPIILTADGKDLGVIINPAEVIVLSDLHPRIRMNLRAQEKRARVGMPQPQKVYADMVKKPE